MGLETGNYIYDLVQANPPAGDQRKEGDDHLRLIKKVLQQTFPHITGPTLPTSTGSANAQLVTHLFAPAAYQAGQIVAFVAGFTNTGAMTLAVNGGLAKNLYIAGAPLPAGAIVAGSLVVAMYDGVQFQVFASAAFIGYLPLTGGTMTGNIVIAPASGNALLTLNAANVAGNQKDVIGQAAGLFRWIMQLGDGAAETGGNVGNDFAVVRYNDAGNIIDKPLIIGRSNGAAIFSANNSFFGSNAGAHTLWLNGAAGTFRTLASQTAGATRWAIFMADSGAEGGGNAGSHFSINRYNDAGVLIDAPLLINRASGVANFSIPMGIQLQVAAGQRAEYQAIVVGQRNWSFGQNPDSTFRINDNSAGAVRLTFDATGKPTFVTAGIGTWTAISDRSLKENIKPLTSSLDKVLALQGVSFNMIDDSERKRQIGLIAQDVESVVPEVVSSNRMYRQAPDAPEPTADEIKADTKLGINYSQLTAVLVEAIKELTASVGELAARVAKLEASNA